MATKPKTNKEKISDTETPEIPELDFHFISKHNNTATHLLANNPNHKSSDGQSRWYTYEFSEPVFIYRVVIAQSNYPEYVDFELKVKTESGKTIQRTASPTTSWVFLEVNDFCSLVSFKPPKAYFSSDKKINTVQIFGFAKSDVKQFIQFARDLGNLKSSAISDIEAIESRHLKTIELAKSAIIEREATLKEVSAAKSQVDRQKANLRRLESERADLTSQVEALKDSLIKNRREIDTLRSELSSKSSEKEQIESEVVEKTRELSSLRSNIDLFPSELDSFVKQGASNTKTLFWLSSAPILIIIIMFALLVYGAADLTSKITSDMNLNVTALVVSRAPYVLISIIIITACYNIAKYFMSELININRQRLNLTKISIIAKDISNAAEIGLQLSDKDKYAFRVRLKMELLRNHLKGYITPDIETDLPNKIVGHFIPSRLFGEGKQTAGASTLPAAPDEAE